MWIEISLIRKNRGEYSVPEVTALLQRINYKSKSIEFVLLVNTVQDKQSQEKIHILLEILNKVVIFVNEWKICVFADRSQNIILQMLIVKICI